MNFCGRHFQNVLIGGRETLAVTLLTFQADLTLYWSAAVRTHSSNMPFNYYIVSFYCSDEPGECLASESRCVGAMRWSGSASHTGWYASNLEALPEDLCRLLRLGPYELREN